jgi:tripartite-type tricarboxylate transporter receptor subunit TctC
MKSRSLCVGVVAVLFASFGAALAEPYPARPIRLVVPFAPGSAADIASRFIAEELAKALAQSVVVTNQVGAGGAVGTAELAGAEPDGHTIGFVSQGTLVFNQAIYARPGYDSLRDFAPIALLGRASYVMIAHPENPASVPADIVALAKAKPGTLTFASAGSGTGTHIAGVLFGKNIGIELVHVPYRGTPQGVLAVMTNEVTMGFFNSIAVVKPIRDGRVKALAVTSLLRLPQLPDVPTLDEQGISGFEFSAWAGFVAPARTPPEIVGRLNAELNKIIAGAEIRDRLVSQGLEPLPPLTSTAITRMIADDLIRWVPIVKASGAKPD